MTAAEPDLRRETAEATRTTHRDRVGISQEIAAALAHELRNPAFAIASAAQLLRYRVTDDPVAEKNIGRILREAERLNALVNALLDYGRPPAVLLAPGNPDQVWAHVIASHRGALESMALLVHHSASSPRVECSIDAEQLAQAFSNALVNAIEAAPNGSDLTIVSSTAPDGSWHSHVHNEGSAIPESILLHAFDPLVTTKPGHAGIGLAVAYRVLVDHGGSVALENDVGGATLTFVLPGAHLP
jgi:signal transduction histidine kinase